MSINEIGVWVPDELPASVRRSTFLDHVEEIFVILWENEDFRAVGGSTDKDDAVEGSRRDDEGETARMIREYAQVNGYPDVAKATLAEIRHAAGVVARRRGVGRNQLAVRKAEYLALLAAGEHSTNTDEPVTV